MSTYRDLWNSGRLMREAAQCRTVAELAQRLGVSEEGLKRAVYTLRQAGEPVPQFRDMLAKGGPQRVAEDFDPPTVRDVSRLVAQNVERREGGDASSQLASYAGVRTPAQPAFSDEPPFRYPAEPGDDGDWEEKTSPGVDIGETSAGIEGSISHRVEQVDPLEEHRLKQKVRELEQRNKWLVESLAKAQDQHEVMQAAREQNVPPIVPRERASGLREGTAVAMLSDLHLEEVVRPEQVQGLNAFNIDIARARMTRFFEGTRSLIEHNRGMFQIRDLVLPLMGDLISGHIHEDLAESTALGPPQAIAFAQQVIADGIHYMLRDPKLERIVVPCVDGNHGRLTVKMRIATRIGHSLEWLCYAQLAREFQREPRVQFILPESELVYYDVYDRTLRIMHGDRVQYGGGVGGITIPLSKVISRLDTSRRAYMTMLGHFHTLQYGMNYVSNGSLIGYGPFSQAIAAPFEWPAQAFFMVDSKRGRCQMTPVWVGDASEQRMAA